jgi:phosphoenolpyruvate-protein kinase (PTS system EI component)
LNPRPFLLGLGLREFSVHPVVLLEIKRIINSSRIDRLEPLACRRCKVAAGPSPPCPH